MDLFINICGFLLFFKIVDTVFTFCGEISAQKQFVVLGNFLSLWAEALQLTSASACLEGFKNKVATTTPGWGGVVTNQREVSVRCSCSLWCHKGLDSNADCFSVCFLKSRARKRGKKWIFLILGGSLTDWRHVLLRKIGKAIIYHKCIHTFSRTKNIQKVIWITGAV